MFGACFRPVLSSRSFVISRRHRRRHSCCWFLAGDYALYVSGRQLNYVKVLEGGNEVPENKDASSLFKDEAPKSSLESVLTGDARNVLDLRRLRALVRTDRFHTGGIERLVIAPVTLAFARGHFDHLAGAFEKGARLDHQ